ncbi:MAG: (2Fe-2S)-binding protein [Actinomycetota bacterium]
MDEGGIATSFTFDGRPITAPVGSTIGAALWAAGVRQWRTTRVFGRPRSLFCGIGQCFDCLVRVNGGLPVRACVTTVVEGDEVLAGDA